VLAQGDLRQYAHRFEPAVEAYTLAASDPRLVVRAELSLFVLQMLLGRFDDAALTCKSLRGHALPGYGIACQSWLLGVVADSEAAISRLQLLLPLLADNPPLAAWAHEILLDLLWQAGRFDSALQLLDAPALASTTPNAVSRDRKLPVEIIGMSIDYLILAGRYNDAERLLDRASDPRPLLLYQEMLQRLTGATNSNPGAGEAIIASYIDTGRIDKYTLVALWRYKIDADPVSALAFARKSWQHFRYVSDALLVRQLALAAGAEEAVREIRVWRDQHAIQSALLAGE
jgi:tetratricopeptide (TPR) repeat protein